MEDVQAQQQMRTARNLVRHATFEAAAADEDPGLYKTRKHQRKSQPYRPHASGGVQLSIFQEFIIYMMFLRRGFACDYLALKFFGSNGAPALRQMRSVLVTWSCAVHGILRDSDWWVYPKDMHKLSSKAFALAREVLAVADCTNVNCQGSDVSELIRQQLFSSYYKHCCGKYCVACSVIGGCVACSTGMGGPAGDHQCILAAGLMSVEKWRVGEGEPRAKLLYDAGVSSRTRVAAKAVRCDLELSGTTRNSAKSNLSYDQRAKNFRVSSLRIRVENFIGIVKNHFKVLGTLFSINDLPIMDKVVFTCFMMHNFKKPIIN